MSSSMLGAVEESKSRLAQRLWYSPESFGPNCAKQAKHLVIPGRLARIGLHPDRPYRVPTEGRQEPETISGI